MANTGHIIFLALFAACFLDSANSQYFGKSLGKLSELHHGVSGEVFAVDGRTLYIKDFTYDGQGPAAYFYASTYKTADSRGFRLRDENNNGDVIRRYRKEGVTLTLPEGKTLNNIKIFYVWCEEFDVNFGDVKIPRNFDFPRPQKIDALNGVHSISSDNIVIVDAQTLLIPNLHYDGEAPDAKFWAGRGPKPSPQGIRIPDENGKEIPLRRYDGKTVVLTLPGDLTVFDIGHFGIWCEEFTVDFGHIQIPQTLNIPPSLKMLGVSPQSKLNCEVLNDELAFEVRWAVAGESIVLQLVAKLADREYMSFGISGDQSRSVMIGGDVVVAWVDKTTLKGYAEDYYLQDKAQCSGPTGSCPDTRFADDTNNIRLLNAAMVNGYSIVTYQRPLKASDQYDQPIITNGTQAIIWAIGPLNQRDEVSFHSSYLKKDALFNFARPAKWNCPLPEGDVPGRHGVTNKQQEHVTEELTNSKSVEDEPIEPSSTTAPRREGGSRRRGGTRIATRPPVADAEAEGQASKREPTRTSTRGSNREGQKGPAPVKSRDAWYIPPIECYEPEDGVFYAQMGPTGGKRGYPAITGHVGWGISWYINGLLIPEINVVRGKTYNFIVEGGNDPEVSAKYHPFYITDDHVGGYGYKTLEERNNITVFSGVSFDKDGNAVPTGTGRLCHWTQTGDKDADDFESFGAYQRTLQLKCDAGEPGIITWTPDKNTPDTVYYQCFTHRHLGWKINVHDTCEQASASEFQPSFLEAPSNVDLENIESIRQETMVKPNHNLFEDFKANDNKSQPTVSENLSTLDQSTLPTSQKKSDQIPKTSLLMFQSPQSHLIDPFGGFARQSQQFLNLRASLPHYMTDINYNNLVFKRMTTTEQPTLATKNVLPLNFIPKPVKILSSPKQAGQLLYLPFNNHNHNKNQFLQQPFLLRDQKKPFYRHSPHIKLIPRPIMYHNIQPQQNLFINSIKSTPQSINTLSKPSLHTQIVSETTTESQFLIKNVEISQQQASTERESQIQTASPLLSIHPSSSENSNITETAVNSGFKPESIVMEHGFKPIISQTIKERLDDNIEIDSEGETGVIREKKSKIKHKKVPKIEHEIVKLIIRTRRLIDSDIEPEMAAADRVESYYLPPANQTEKPKLSGGKLTSEIDFDNIDSNVGRSSKKSASPPDVFVTFDGKRISGASLTAKPFDRTNVLQRGSKATEYLKSLPQSAPFSGDLPPLNSNVLFNSKLQNPNSKAVVLNRDLDTPLSPSPSGTTKLRRVRRDSEEVI